MTKLTSLIACAAAVGMLTGCGRLVEVPPAHVAKINTSGGLQQEIIQPSKFRLPVAWPGTIPPTLILCEASDQQIKEELLLWVPKDQLNLRVEVRGTLSISADESNVDKIFARQVAQNIDARISKISLDTVYSTYGLNVVREIVRNVLSKYTINEIMSGRESIGIELFNSVNSALKETPIKFTTFSLASLQPPDIIVNAQEKAKEREVAIQQAQAERLIAVAKAEAALEVARKQQEVELLEAETQVLVDRKLGEGVNEAYVLQRALTVWSQLATNSSKVFIIPSEAIKNPALLIGAFNK